MSQNYNMDPIEIAEGLSPSDEKCPSCGNHFGAVVDNANVCPNKRCEYYNEEYRKNLTEVLLFGGPVSGVKDYETLESWIKLNVPVKKLYTTWQGGRSIPDTIASMLSKWIAEKAVRDRKAETLLAELFLYGYEGLKGNTEIMNDELKTIYKENNMIDFLEMLAAAHGAYMNYEEEEEL